jgi:putative flippase GtrA
MAHSRGARGASPPCMRQLLQAYLRSPSRIAQFLRFATVGVKISFIDLGGLYLLPWLFGMDHSLARVFSLSAALLAGYLLNRHFTFAPVRRPGRFLPQLAGHFGVHLLGAGLNYGAFLLVLSYGRLLVWYGMPTVLLPLLGLWIGGMVGLTFNFVAVKTFVFRSRPVGATVGEDLHPALVTVRARRER